MKKRAERVAPEALLHAEHHCICGRDPLPDGKWGWLTLFYHLEEGALSQHEAEVAIQVVRDLEGHRLCWPHLVALLKLVDVFYALLEERVAAEELIALLGAFLDARLEQGASCPPNTSPGPAKSS